MPRIPVNQLRQNMALTKQLFLLRDKSTSTTRTGSAMLRVTLADRTGTLAGVYFDVPAHITESLLVGQGVEVTGRIGEFKEQMQVAIERITPVRLTNLAEYLPVARRPLPEMEAELKAVRAEIQHPDLERLLAALLDEPGIYKAFTQAPAAKFNHHACLGGLLEHTLSVVRLVRTACVLYPELDADLVTTVALLHDLGKIRAYDPTSFDMTEEGSLWSHLYSGASQVEQAISALPDFDPELRMRVVHAILAHHGRLENGSPVRPMTLEAVVLHYADNLDGDARGVIDHLERAEGDRTAFTDFSSMHETRLYRGAPEDGATSGLQQKTLF